MYLIYMKNLKFINCLNKYLIFLLGVFLFVPLVVGGGSGMNKEAEFMFDLAVLGVFVVFVISLIISLFAVNRRMPKEKIGTRIGNMLMLAIFITIAFIVVIFIFLY